MMHNWRADFAVKYGTMQHKLLDNMPPHWSTHSMAPRSSRPTLGLLVKFLLAWMMFAMILLYTARITAAAVELVTGCTSCLPTTQASQS